MSAASIAAGEKANLDTEHLFGRFPKKSVRRTTVRFVEAAMRAAQILWPENTAAEIATRAHTSTRAAEYWIAGARAPNAEALLNLVMTTGGDGVLIIEGIAAALPDHERRDFWAAMSRAVQRVEATARRDAAIEELATLTGPERLPRAASKKRARSRLSTRRA